MNSGGKTNGYTVPNPNAQSQLIAGSYKRSGINARIVSYLEAHGTGTPLGDPIEIAGLTRAFSENSSDKQFCSIGSVKSNIGHCESAAGIAGVTKVLLQLKHRQLVPSLHSQALNPIIDFSNTPFTVQQTLAEWRRPVVTIGGTTKEYPRTAGISSFGAGGANAHVVIQEYIFEEPEQPEFTVSPSDRSAPATEQAIIVLSARDEDRLQEQVRQLLGAIREPQFADAELANNALAAVAYTLQVGREAMEERLGVIVASLSELDQKLQDYLEGRDGIDTLYRGQSNRNQETLAALAADQEMQETIVKWVERNKHGKILELWVNGLEFDWNKLYGKIKPRRISLPTYPFAKERYWLTAPNAKSGVTALSPVKVLPGGYAIHPLLQQNTSDLSEQRFSSLFTGQEFFMDYFVLGQRFLPGGACLEMARAAVAVATNAKAPGTAAAGMMEEGWGIQLQNIVWARPIKAGSQPLRIHIGLFPEETGEVGYEIYSFPDDCDAAGVSEAEPIIYSQGSVISTPVNSIETMDLAAIQAQCTQGVFSAEEIYQTYQTLGIEYGPGYLGN